MRNFIRYVSGSLTESEIRGTSGNSRRFFLCKNRNTCLKIHAVVELFRTHRERTVKEPSAAAATKTLASIPPPSCFTSGNSSKDQNRDLLTRLNRFARRDPVTAHIKYSRQPEAEHGGGGGTRSKVLDMCSKFCKTSHRPARQVPFYCPFPVYIPIYF